VHNAAAPGTGNIGVLVAMTGGDEAFGKQVAMHIAAVNPALVEADPDPAKPMRKKSSQVHRHRARIGQA
jgi:elongation factor Ts